MFSNKNFCLEYIALMLTTRYIVCDWIVGPARYMELQREAKQKAEDLKQKYTDLAKAKGVISTYCTIMGCLLNTWTKIHFLKRNNSKINNIILYIVCEMLHILKGKNKINEFDLALKIWLTFLNLSLVEWCRVESAY